MDARVAEFMQMMGLEKHYQNGLRKVVDQHRENPAFKAANHTNESVNKIISDAARSLTDEFGRLMNERFEPKHLDALLRFMNETEGGQDAVFGLYMTQHHMADPAVRISTEMSNKLFVMPKK